MGAIIIVYSIVVGAALQRPQTDVPTDANHRLSGFLPFAALAGIAALALLIAEAVS